jgi:hypothetical protein
MGGRTGEDRRSCDARLYLRHRRERDRGGGWDQYKDALDIDGDDDDGGAEDGERVSEEASHSEGDNREASSGYAASETETREAHGEASNDDLTSSNEAAEDEARASDIGGGIEFGDEDEENDAVDVEYEDDGGAEA